MKKRRSPEPAPKPAGKFIFALVGLTAAAALVMLVILARDILAQLRQVGGAGGAESTRLLTGLFVIMCFAGFTAAALWAVIRKFLDAGGKPDDGKK